MWVLMGPSSCLYVNTLTEMALFSIISYSNEILVTSVGIFAFFKDKRFLSVWSRWSPLQHIRAWCLDRMFCVRRES